MPGSSVKALSDIGTFDNFTDPDITEAYWHRIVGKGDPGHLLILSTCCGEDNIFLSVGYAVIRAVADAF